MRQTFAFYTYFSKIATPSLYYTANMKFLYLYNLMALSAFWGIFWSIFIFGICFLCVHTVKLLRFGWKYQKQQKQELAVTKETEKAEHTTTQEPQKAAAATPPKEIYYIVERKRKAPPYSTPKRIDFK